MTLATLILALWGNSQVPTGLPGPTLTGKLTCSATSIAIMVIIISGLEGTDPLILPMVMLLPRATGLSEYTMCW